MNEQIEQELAWEKEAAQPVTITKEDWFSLRKSKSFYGDWNNSDIGRLYPIIKTCLWRGFSEAKVLMVVRLWYGKHKHHFDPDEFTRFYQRSLDQEEPKILTKKGEKYWKEIRRIQFDKYAKSHQKMRVAYYLNNVRCATAEQIADTLSLPIKTVRNALTALQKSKRIGQLSYAVYQALHSFTWDRFLDDDPAISTFGTPNEVGKNGRMRVWDYTNDVPLGTVPRDASLEWVVTHEKKIVQNASCVEIWPDPLVTHDPDLENVDFLSRLSV